MEKQKKYHSWKKIYNILHLVEHKEPYHVFHNYFILEIKCGKIWFPDQNHSKVRKSKPGLHLLGNFQILILFPDFRDDIIRNKTGVFQPFWSLDPQGAQVFKSKYCISILLVFLVCADKAANVMAEENSKMQRSFALWLFY